MKKFSIIKFTNTLTIFFLNTQVVSGRVMAHNIHSYLCPNKALDKGLFSGILLTDLSKGFDCISHDLLIAELNAYGFPKQALNLFNDYFCNRYQRTKVGEIFNTWHELIGVPQGSILGALLFNIYIPMTYFYFPRILIWPITQMTVPHMNLVVLSKKSF